jgi:hypothetical protein
MRQQKLIKFFSILLFFASIKIKAVEYDHATYSFDFYNAGANPTYLQDTISNEKIAIIGILL